MPGKRTKREPIESLAATGALEGTTESKDRQKYAGRYPRLGAKLKCAACEQEKSRSEFNDHSEMLKQAYCRECQAAAARAHYRDNKAAYYSRAHENRRAGLAERLELVKRLLPAHCAMCPAEISIDKVRRLPRGRAELHKDATPRGMATQGWAAGRIKDEMENCVFVCPSCYRAQAKNARDQPKSPGRAI